MLDFLLTVQNPPCYRVLFQLEDVNGYIYDLKPSREPIKYRTCEELRCHAGGHCVPDEMRGGVRCQCQLGQTGESCEQGERVRGCDVAIMGRDGLG